MWEGKKWSKMHLIRSYHSRKGEASKDVCLDSIIVTDLSKSDYGVGLFMFHSITIIE